MPYHFIASDSHQLVLQRQSVKTASIVFTVVGTLFFLVGVAVNLLSDDFEFPFLLFKILFPLMGLIFAAVGISMPAMTRKSTPELITFDNRKGYVAIQMAKQLDQTGYIRYDEIEKFDIYVESRSSTSSSSRSSTSRTYYYYHVFLLKKDGGEWFLTESGTRNAAEELLAKFNTAVQLNTPCAVKPSPVFPDKIEKDEFTGKTVLRWQNKVSILAPLALFVFATIFVSILSTVFSDSSFAFSLFPMAIAGFMLLVFGLVVFIIGRRLFKDATSIYSILIDKTQLEYQELSKASVLRKSRVVPLTEVHSISYSYSPVKDYGAGGLQVLTKKDLETIRLYKDKPTEALKDFFTGKEGPVKFNLTALTPVECLELETWLQELIRKKSNIEVL